MDPSTRFVRSLEGDYLMVREAAETLGVRHTVLRTLMRQDHNPPLAPSFCAFFGKVKIYLYTREDIARIREYLTKRRQVFPNDDVVAYKGRPRLWTDAERKVRNRLYSRAYYYRKKVEEHTKAGNAEAAALAQIEVDECEAELESMDKEKQ